MIKEFYRNRKVLITGHTGFKGTWMCEVLVSLGADVYGYALNPPTDPSLFEREDAWLLRHLHCKDNPIPVRPL